MFGIGRRKDETVIRAGVSLPADTLVYAVGDIHGRADLLHELQAMIVADAAERGADHRTVIYLGDYVDRGPDSRQVVSMLLEAPLDGFQSVHLIGNHEDFLLRFLEDESAAAAWLPNGGLATLASYGVDPWMRESDDNALLEMQRAFRRRLPPRHLAFFNDLALWHRVGDYYFVHAGVRPNVPLERQQRDDMLWIREPFLDSRADHGAVVVHGHSIRRRPERRDNRIGVDTGAYASGCLTALALEPAEGGVAERFLQTER
jgi:serine/threonine protein phosphatase 1